MNNVQKIPYNAEAENYIIGCMFIEPDIVSEVLNRISPENFYVKANANIVQAISNLYRNSEIIDQVKVIDELERLKLLVASGGKEYLFNIIDSIPIVANVEAYIEIIEEKALLRELYYAAQSVQTDIIKGEMPFNVIGEEAERKMLNVIEMRKTSEIKKIHRFTDHVLDIIEKNKTSDGLTSGLDTGYDQLNNLTFGLQPEELIILAARPGVGKSTLALNIASNVCRIDNASVAFFSLEMGVDQLTMRLFSDFSGIPLNKLRKGDLTAGEISTLLIAKNDVDKLNLYLDDSSNTNIGDIRAKCLKLKRENKLDLVIIDYLQLVNVLNFKGNRVDEVGRISRALKTMARELKVPVIALSQLSRKAEDAKGEEDGKPRLSHLRESGSIEQDADIVIFLHRERSKNIEGSKQKSHRVEVIVAKNRQGQTDSFYLMFVGSKSKFTALDPKAISEKD